LVAERDRQPEERLEGHLRATDLIGQLEGPLELGRGLRQVAVAPEQDAAHRVRKAELAGQALALGEGRRGLGLALHRIPLATVHGQSGERGVELDLGRQVADLLG
jgi:hypothetical protein